MKNPLKNLSLGRKVLLLGITGVIFLTAILGYSSYKTTKSNLIDETFHRLTVLEEAKKEHVEDYFSYMEALLSSLANTGLVRESLAEFTNSFYNLENELGLDLNEVKRALLKEYQTHYLNLVNRNIPGAPPPKPANFYLPRNPNGLVAQFIFIVENPYPVGKKNQLSYNEKYPCSYTEVHRKFHPDFNQLLIKFGLYDIFLVDKKGTVVYTDFKEKDFATNLLTGPYSDTGLAKAFKKALNLPPGKVAFSDFSPYEPSYNQPAAFIATPVYNGNEELGVLIFQLPIDKIDEIVNFHYHFKEAGLGNTGEVYLVGEDLTLRNNVRFLKKIEDPLVEKAETTIGVLKVKTEAVKNALMGIKGTAFSKDFFGKDSLVAYAPINVFGKRWAIVAEIEEGEILSGAFSLSKNRILVFVVILLTLGTLLFFLFVKTYIISPLQDFVSATQDLAEGEGDLTKRLKVESEDEIGKAAKYFNVFIEKVRTIIERAKASLKKNVETATFLKNSAEKIKKEVEEIRETVAQTTETALNMTEPLKNFQELMATTEEEIRKATDKLKITVKNIEKLQSTVEKTEKESSISVQELKNLNKKAEGIRDIISVIEDVTEKTNLLALNASIEAAKAGESGKGFAVVANEIRKLAEQIQKNTVNINNILSSVLESISETTGKIEKSNNENVKFLRTVSATVIDNVKDVNDTMKKTREISETLKNTADDLIREVESLIGDIKEIGQISESNARNIEAILDKIKELYKEIDELNAIMSTFKTE